jgi:hypothetical protein
VSRNFSLSGGSVIQPSVQDGQIGRIASDQT